MIGNRRAQGLLRASCNDKTDISSATKRRVHAQDSSHDAFSRPGVVAGLSSAVTMPASAAARISHRGHAATSVEVSGTVTSSGTDAPGGKGTTHAWPNQAVDHALKVGQTVPWTLVGSATSDANGRFSIAVPLSKLMPESTSGVVNLEADSSAGSSIFPVVVTKNAGNSFLTPDPVANIDGGPPPGNFKCNGDWDYQG